VSGSALKWFINTSASLNLLLFTLLPLLRPKNVESEMHVLFAFVPAHIIPKQRKNILWSSLAKDCMMGRRAMWTVETTKV
jgi:hypothetical protein